MKWGRARDLFAQRKRAVISVRCTYETTTKFWAEKLRSWEVCLSSRNCSCLKWWFQRRTNPESELSRGTGHRMEHRPLTVRIESSIRRAAKPDGMQNCWTIKCLERSKGCLSSKRCWRKLLKYTRRKKNACQKPRSEKTFEASWRLYLKPWFMKKKNIIVRTLWWTAPTTLW